MKKLTFLYTHPIQYFAPLQAEITSASFCDCQVLFCEDTTRGYYDTEFGKEVSWDIPLLKGYNYAFLPNSRLSRVGGFFRLSNFSVRKYLRKNKTDILVVHGWNYFTAVFAIVYAWIKGIEVWLRAENPYNQEMQKPWYVRFAKKIFLQHVFFKMINKFLYIGTENSLFYKYYGVSEKNLIFCPYCVDNQRLQESMSSLGTKNWVRRQLGISPDDFVVFFSGKLIPKKRPMDLIQAFYNAAIPQSKLIMAGDGSLATALQRFIEEHAIDNVVLAGFKNQTELPAYYYAADLFVLPSDMGETWGLVVNEAMNYSLPVIVSRLTGSSTDLVKEGENGFLFDTGNIEQLADALKKAASDRQWLQQAGQHSLQMVQLYSYSKIVSNIKTAL